MKFVEKYSHTVDWEKLPLIEKDSTEKIPWSLWVPYCGACSLVELLSEVWEEDPGTDRIVNILGEVQNIASSAGLSHLGKVHQELFSSETWKIELQQEPLVMRSYHEGVFAVGFLWGMTLGWTICGQMLTNHLIAGGKAAELSYDPSNVDIEVARQVVGAGPVLTDTVQKMPLGWDAVYIKSQLDCELYNAIRYRRTADIKYDSDDRQGVPSLLELWCGRMSKMNKGGRPIKYQGLVPVYERGRSNGKWDSVEGFYNALVEKGSEIVTKKDGEVIKLESFKKRMSKEIGKKKPSG